jgi:2-polyprenyl-3-methyl-5-hydroxy-6-metoxy-1,4-benzoquinol methylase
MQQPEPQMQQPEPQMQQPEPQMQQPVKETIDETLLEEQKKARQKHVQNLLEIDCWPEAVPEFLITQDASEEDQTNRANAVLDMMLDKSLEDVSFLDYGCGEGWIAKQALQRGAASSTGFDILESENWDNIENVCFTNNIKDLKENFYDIVMIYDVLDHCKDPVNLMKNVKKYLKKNGTVYVRCHPWVSKHATHLYKQGINKAFIHLFLSYEEILEILKEKVEDPLFTRVEKNPIAAYHYWFKEFEIKKERFVNEPVSDFFYVDAFKELLANEQDVPMEHIDEFMKGLEIQFIDYCLTSK